MIKYKICILLSLSFLIFDQANAEGLRLKKKSNPTQTTTPSTSTGSTSTGTTATPDYNKKLCSSNMSDDQCNEYLVNFCKDNEGKKYSDCKVFTDTPVSDQKGGADDDADSGSNSTNGKSNNASKNIQNAGKVISAASTASQLMFSPTAFGIQQAAGFVQSVFTCKSDKSEEEKSLSTRRGAKLCTQVGDAYCSKKIKIGFITMCKTKKTSFCCYNSTLARIINTEGRKQLGNIGNGTPENPDCSGFTLADFNKLDLSKMDLSEFTNEITEKAKNSASKSKEYWGTRNENRVRTANVAKTTSGDVAQDILTADDPNKAFSSASMNGSSYVSKELNKRSVNDTVENETYNSDSIKNPQKITDHEAVTQADIDQGNQKIAEKIATN